MTPSTRRPLTRTELSAVLAPLGGVVADRVLTGGLFASVQAAELTDGRTVVVKTGTPDDAATQCLLTYERDLLRGEAFMLGHAGRAPGVPSPAVLLLDLDRAVVDVDVLVVEHLPGVAWEGVRAELDPSVDARLGQGVGRVLAALHAVPLADDGAVGPARFGYPADGFALGAGTWPEAVALLVDAVLRDADRWGVDVQAGAVLRAVGRAGEALAEVVAPRLVHMDMWPGNVLVDAARGTVTGVVDFERGLFADPLMDLVGAEPLNVGAPSPTLLAGYRSGGGTLPLDPAAGTVSGLTAAADVRLALYRLYLNLIMTVETVPRAYDGAWVGPYLTSLAQGRATLLAHLG
ncbi:phosphotransferase family protein [Actinotalea subterranea]|uniref:phosphotransferase family protein n=1 Tax=Actinotalea subterranea TaxID=2607497 RepID=UPI0011EF01EC|nr:aminoglycoside phosphotransferase family protein [Actinotalea subterranea]